MRQGANKESGRPRQAATCAGMLLAVFLLPALALQAKEGAMTPSQPAIQEVPSVKRVLVLSIPDRKLALIENGVLLRTFDVAVGKDSTPSPAGDLKIINKLKSPTYYHKGLVVKPGKGNPLGNRWMGLSKPGYGIHGTNVQISVGKAASHGCFRMRKQDVEELFSLVHVGDAVEIHNKHDQQVAAIFGDAGKTGPNAEPESVAKVIVTVPAAEESTATNH